MKTLDGLIRNKICTLIHEKLILLITNILTNRKFGNYHLIREARSITVRRPLIYDINEKLTRIYDTN